MLTREQAARHELETARQQLSQKNEQLAVLASTDALTGLANRVSLWEHLSLALARATRTGTAVVAVYIDLDGFKQVNDEFGHEVGDELLRNVAARL